MGEVRLKANGQRAYVITTQAVTLIVGTNMNVIGHQAPAMCVVTTPSLDADWGRGPWPSS